MRSKVDVRRKAARLKKKEKREKKHQSCHLAERPISRKNKFLRLMWAVEKRIFFCVRSNYRKALIFKCVTRAEVVIGSNEGHTEPSTPYFDIQPFICTDLPRCNFGPTSYEVVRSIFIETDKVCPPLDPSFLDFAANKRIIILMRCCGSKKRKTTLIVGTELWIWNTLWLWPNWNVK